MAKVTIKRRTDFVRSDGRAALYVNINIGSSKIRIPLNIAVKSSDWDSRSEKVKGRTQEAKDMNLIISNTKARISDILVRARLTGEEITKEKFIALYKRPAETMNFISFAEHHLEELRSVLQPQTRKHHLSVLKKLKAYNPNLTFEDITVDWLRIYAAYLRDNHGNNQNTIGKNMSVIRMHYTAALRAGKVNDNPFEFYRVPAVEPAVIFLNEEELHNLTSLYKSGHLPDNEQDVLRFFLFMTFTAMHISDARNLQIENIHNDEIIYKRLKTGTRVQIPLSVPAKKLVEFYKAGRYKGFLLTKLPTDQAFNRIIKKVCKKAGIEKAVSAKAARHTFATLYYKKNAGDLGTLSKLLGHTSVNTTMIYAHIMKDSRVAGVSAFDNML